MREVHPRVHIRLAGAVADMLPSLRQRRPLTDLADAAVVGLEYGFGST